MIRRLKLFIFSFFSFLILFNEKIPIVYILMPLIRKVIESHSFQILNMQDVTYAVLSCCSWKLHSSTKHVLFQVGII